MKREIKKSEKEIAWYKERIAVIEANMEKTNLTIESLKTDMKTASDPQFYKDQISFWRRCKGYDQRLIRLNKKMLDRCEARLKNWQNLSDKKAA